jgi:hypothetical protein
MRLVGLAVLGAALGRRPTPRALIEQAPDKQTQLQLEVIRRLGPRALPLLCPQGLALVAPRQPRELGLPRAQPRLLLGLELFGGKGGWVSCMSFSSKEV